MEQPKQNSIAPEKLQQILRTILHQVEIDQLDDPTQKAIQDFLENASRQNQQRVWDLLPNHLRIKADIFEVNSQKKIPLEKLRDYISLEENALQKFLVETFDQYISLDEMPDLLSFREVRKYADILDYAKLSLIDDYIHRTSTVTLRGMKLKMKQIRFKSKNRPFTNYDDAYIDFEGKRIVASEAARINEEKVYFTTNIHINELEMITWDTQSRQQQELFNFLLDKRDYFDKILETIKALYLALTKQKNILTLINEYDDIYNVGALTQHKAIKEFQEILTRPLELNIPLIDNMIREIAGNFRTFLGQKVSALNFERESQFRRELIKRTVDPTTLIIRHEKETEKGSGVRYFEYDPQKTYLELIPPHELGDAKKIDRNKYIPIPYFETNDKEWAGNPIPFVITEWHLKHMINLLPLLYDYHTMNTLFIGLAGTGKDYIIKFLAHLMNMKLCEVNCKEVVDIDSIFFVRDLVNGNGIIRETMGKFAYENPGCIFYLAEISKLGTKISDINSAGDFNRCIYNQIENKRYFMPVGNFYWASDNPSWYGGGREKLSPDAKDRFGNIILYDYPPFFDYQNEEQKINAHYFSHEAELWYSRFPVLLKMKQIDFRKMWYEIFNKSNYNPKNDRVLFAQSNNQIRSIIALKNIIRFAARHRDEYIKVQTGQSSSGHIITETVSLRGAEYIVNKLNMIDPEQKSYESYQKAVKMHLYDRFDIRTAQFEIPVVEQFLL